jgi:hypothetical protein
VAIKTFNVESNEWSQAMDDGQHFNSTHTNKVPSISVISLTWWKKFSEREMLLFLHKSLWKRNFFISRVYITERMSGYKWESGENEIMGWFSCGGYKEMRGFSEYMSTYFHFFLVEWIFSLLCNIQKVGDKNSRDYGVGIVKR